MGEDRPDTADEEGEPATGRPYLSIPWHDEGKPPTTVEADALQPAKQLLLDDAELASTRYPPWPHWEPSASPRAELVFDEDGEGHVVFQSFGDVDPRLSRDELLDRIPGHRLRAYREGFTHLAETRTELADQRREGPYQGPTTRMDPYTLAPRMAERMPDLVPADDEDPENSKRFRSEKDNSIWHVVPEGTSRVRIDPAFAFHLYLEGDLKHAGHEARSGDRYCLVQRRDKPRGNEALHRIAPLYTEGEELPVCYKTAVVDMPEVQA